MLVVLIQKLKLKKVPMKIVERKRLVRRPLQLQKQFRVMHNRRALVKQTVLRNSLLVMYQKAKLSRKQNT
jgi:hypothetical protein